MELTFDRISAGGSHTCGITVANRAYCWGQGSAGQLEHAGGPEPQRDAGRLPSPEASDSRKSPPGAPTPCAIPLAIVPATLECCGSVVGDGSGTGALVPTQVLRSRVGKAWSRPEVSAGNGHTCGRGSGGTAYCSGADPLRQRLGTGRRQARARIPVAVQTSADVRRPERGRESIPAGSRTSEALMCWGDNGFGQVGDGTTTATGCLRSPCPIRRISVR
ncbi:MAG: RCC1 domain-containing protein [Gemmatimonadota bacterium]|nr:RCC1 domain-containing protein [Gemmatimonadota bacterium]